MAFGLAFVVLCLACTVGWFSGSAIGLSKDKFVSDCAAETYAVPSRPSKIKFVVWCGVREDDVAFSLRRLKEGRIKGYNKELKAWGRGATAPFRCSRHDEAVRCVGRKIGPVKVQGWLTVEDEPCAARISLGLGGTGYVSKPNGCPGTQRFWPHWNVRHLQNERRRYGFDADLEGVQAAIERRIRGLIRDWRRGEPVARGTAGFLRMPMRAWEQREWEYRSEYIRQFPEAFEDWASVFARDTFAGYYVDHKHGGTIYVGFVGDQEAQLAAFIASGRPMAPERLKSFPVPPKNSIARLSQLQSELGDAAAYPRGPGWEDIIRIGIDVQANVVAVHTEQVDAVRKVIEERFGPATPIVVAYGRPIPRVGGLNRRSLRHPERRIDGLSIDR